MQIFVFTKISDYPHLNITMKFSSTYISEDLSFSKFYVVTVVFSTLNLNGRTNYLAQMLLSVKFMS